MAADRQEKIFMLPRSGNIHVALTQFSLTLTSIYGREYHFLVKGDIESGSLRRLPFPTANSRQAENSAPHSSDQEDFP